MSSSFLKNIGVESDCLRRLPPLGVHAERAAVEVVHVVDAVRVVVIVDVPSVIVKSSKKSRPSAGLL